MQRLNSGFGKFTDADLLVLATAIVNAISGSPLWPTPIPTLAVLQTAINDYSTALADAKDGGRSNTTIKNARRQDLTVLLVQLGNYLTLTANGSVEMLSQTLYPMEKVRQPLPPLDQPKIVKIEDGVNSGELLVTIAALLGARTYLFQYTEDPMTANSVWTSQNATVTKMLFTGLTPGKKYWIRVIAYGTNEQEVIGEALLSQIVR